MPYLLADVRESLLGSWTPPSALLTPAEATNLQQHWAELANAGRAELWKSVTMLAGQVVEALLRKKLLLAGHRVAGPRMLGQLINSARSAGLLPDYDSPPTGANAISAALTLRNWSSHFSLWFDYPTERRAVQAIALMISVTESLFPRQLPTFCRTDPLGDEVSTWPSNWANLAPSVVVTILRRWTGPSMPEILGSSPEAVYSHVLKFGTFSTILGLSEVMQNLSLPTEPFRDALHHNFAPLVQRSSSEPAQRLLKILSLVRSVALEQHAEVFSILLPFDAKVFASLLRTRPPAWVAVYVMECFRAEPHVFSAAAGHADRMEDAVTAFWDRFGDGQGNILNMANILLKMPLHIRARFLRSAPRDKLLHWLQASDPADSVNLLGSVSTRIVDQAPDLRDLQRAIVDAVKQRLTHASAGSLQQIPLRMKRLNLTDDDAALQVLAHLLVIFPLADWDAARRILWDIFAFCPKLRPQAADAASELLRDPSQPIPEWHQLCLLGMLALAGHSDLRARSRSISATEGDFVTAIGGTKRDRWQILAAGWGLVQRLRVQNRSVPAAISRKLLDLLAETRDPGEGPSRELLAKVKEALSQEERAGIDSTKSATKHL